MAENYNSSFKGFGVRAKLMSAILAILLITLGIVWYSFFTLKKQESDSSIINIAGRQRMLTQKMSKEVMAIANGVSVNEQRSSLKKTHDLFQKSHTLLMQGDAELGLPPTKDGEVLRQLELVGRLWVVFSDNVQKVISSDESSPQFQTSVDVIMKNNITLLQEMNKGVGLYEEMAKRKIQSLKLYMLLGAVVSLLTAIVFWFLIQRTIISPLRRTGYVIGELEKGHLDERLDLFVNDEIGEMAGKLNHFADSLKHEVVAALKKLAEGDLRFETRVRDEQDEIGLAMEKTCADLNRLLGGISMVTSQIAMGASEVSSASNSLSDGAMKQAASIEEISSSMTELSSQTTTNADNAEQARVFANQVQKDAEVGNKQMEEMVSTMEEINESGKRISKIIQVVDEIAFQTNLLALNAAVEAARAGQHGKGFAVVAEEVRNLAARSAKAAAETAELIEESVEKTTRGKVAANSTAVSLHKIVDGVDKINQLVGEISIASNEQAAGIHQSNEALVQVDMVIQTNTAAAEQCAASAHQLSGQSENMRGLVSSFKTKSDGQVTINPQLQGNEGLALPQQLAW